jgi:hypothetical protein
LRNHKRNRNPHRADAIPVTKMRSSRRMTHPNAIAPHGQAA